MPFFGWGRPEFSRPPEGDFPRRGWAGDLRAAVDKGGREHLRACLPPGMLRKLDIKNEDDVKSLSRVMAHVFSDGVTNWGRIVTLISFGAFVAKHLKSINQESCIEPLAESITDVLVRTKREWLVKQRGWVSSLGGRRDPLRSGPGRGGRRRRAGVAGADLQTRLPSTDLAEGHSDSVAWLSRIRASKIPVLCDLFYSLLKLLLLVS